MAKFTTVGYIAPSKKDPKKYNLVLEENGVKQYYILSGKPTESEVEANPKLAQVAEKWASWKKFNVVKVSDE